MSEPRFINLDIRDPFVAALVDRRSVDIELGRKQKDVRTVLLMTEQLEADGGSDAVGDIREVVSLEKAKSRSETAGLPIPEKTLDSTKIRLLCANDISLDFAELIKDFDARAIDAKAKFLEGEFDKTKLMKELKKAARPIRRCIDTIVKITSSLDRQG